MENNFYKKSIERAEKELKAMLDGLSETKKYFPKTVYPSLVKNIAKKQKLICLLKSS